MSEVKIKSPVKLGFSIAAGMTLFSLAVMTTGVIASVVLSSRTDNN